MQKIKETLGSHGKTMDILNRFGVFMALILICIVMSMLSDSFMTSRNIINIVRQIAVYGLLAIGVTLVVITGEIDLSVGSLVAISGVTTASLIKAEMPLFVCILCGLLIGVVAGLITGVLVTYGNVPSFIATLGMMCIARGFSLILSGGYPISGLGDSFRMLGKGEIWIIPVPMILLVIALVIINVVLHRTKFGRELYAIGGSRKAALYSGINVKRQIIKAFMLSGFFAALGGIVLAARLDAAETIAGEGYEQTAIASVVIGGASLTGGRGSVIGTCLGTMIIGVISNGMTLLAVAPYWQQVVRGAIIILAVLLNTMQTKDKK